MGIVVIEVTKPYGRSGLEAPDGEPVVCLMVTNDVARPRGFRYLVYWREKWWHDMVHADTKDNLRIYLEPIERARRVERAACRWARENVRLG